MKNKNKNLPVNITFYINLQILNFTPIKQVVSKIIHISTEEGELPTQGKGALLAETCQEGPSPLAKNCQKGPSLVAIL